MRSTSRVHMDPPQSGAAAFVCGFLYLVGDLQTIRVLREVQKWRQTSNEDE